MGGREDCPRRSPSIEGRRRAFHRVPRGPGPSNDELVARLLGLVHETQRSDDNEAVIQHRLDLYHEQTGTVVARYSERGNLVQMDGVGGIDEVTERAVWSSRV